MRVERVAIAAFGALLASSSGDASAFCRTSSCPDSGTAAVCSPAAAGDCGIPLAWATPCVGFSVQKDGSRAVSSEVTAGLLQSAFDTWMSADCGGGTRPHIAVRRAEDVDCGDPEYNQTKGNANVVMYRDDSWPYQGLSNTLALTTVTYDLDSGEIYDADMELNSFGTSFTTADAGVLYDLSSILQHETGHFLGLAHSPNSDSTMFASYRMGDVGLRSLSADDVGAICAVYPPGAPIDASCATTPRHGFSTVCGDEQPDVFGGCCSIALGSSERSWLGAGGLVALAALAAVRRRRSRA